MADVQVKVTIYEREAVRQARRIARPDLVKIAGKVSGDASGFAPVRTGKYAGSFSVQTGNGVRVVSSDDRSFYKEYGTSKTPAHAALTEAAMRYGKYSGMQPRGRRIR